MEYIDYYKILGIPRNATQEEIRRAYRKRARKYHPDVNKDKNAEEEFKRVNEAHEVLKDPEKRKLYDTYGKDWQNGAHYQHGSGREDVFQQQHRQAERARTYRFSSDGSFSGTSDFSDFFDNLFGHDFTDGHRKLISPSPCGKSSPEQASPFPCSPMSRMQPVRSPRRRGHFR